MLIGTLLLSSIAFSQTDTQSNDSTLHIPVHIARQIVADLMMYDGCKEELESTLQLIALANQRNQKQSLLIEEKEKQYIMCRDQVQALDQKVDLYIKANKELTAQNAKLKRTNLILIGTTGVSIAVVVAIILVK